MKARSPSDNALQHLRRLGHRLGQFPIALFGFIYLISIPAFAWAYTFLESEFYDSAAIHEPMVLAQEQSIAKRIQAAFGASPRLKNTNYGQGVMAHEFPMISVYPEPDYTKVLVRLLNPHPEDGRNFFTVIELDVSDTATLISDKVLPRLSPEWFSNELMFVTAKAQVLSGEQILLPDLFPCWNGAPKEAVCLQMTVRDYSTLMSLSSTAAGHPSPYQASFWRMVYFSAVTISTLGYGDIVPVTQRARLLVTVEVVLGPVLFALFVNALLSQRQSSKDPAGSSIN